MPKKIKYLVETSSVPVALGESTPSHCGHFRSKTSDGKLYSSIYIRKEFIHRWVLDYIEMAFTTDHFDSLSHALYHLSHDFSPRAVKTNQHALALLLQEKGRIANCRSAAKELGRLAVGELKKFDRILKSRLPRNACGCSIGGKELSVDHNYFFDDLRKFVESQGVVRDCPINEFLGFSGSGRARRLVEAPDVAEQTKSGKKLSEFLSKGTWITCRECQAIGDAIIALEQPSGFCLVHIDRDFKVLCAASNKPHKQIQSERAVESDTP